MGTIKITNHSTLTDYAAVTRAGIFMAGDAYDATHDSEGKEVVKITRRGNTYIATDKED